MQKKKDFTYLPTLFFFGPLQETNNFFFRPYTRDVIDSRQIDKSTFSICQLNRIEWLGIESK